MISTSRWNRPRRRPLNDQTLRNFFASALAVAVVAFLTAAMAGAGSTVIHIETEKGGVVYTDGAVNLDGAIFWGLTSWGVNDTYGHMYFVDLTTGQRLKTFTTTEISGTQPLGQVLVRDGYTIDREAYSYAKRSVTGGAFFVEAVAYRIAWPPYDHILLLSRSTGHGTDDAAFDVIMRDPDLAETTTALLGDPVWYTVQGDIDTALAALPDPALKTGDLPSVNSRYFFDVDGGSEMGGVSYTFLTHAFGPADADVAGQRSAFIAEFSIQYTDGSSHLQDIKLLPTVVSEEPARYDLVIPAAANTAGDSGTRWQTDLDLLNPDAETTAQVELALLRANQANSSPLTAPATVPPGQTLRLANVLGSTFSAGNAAIGVRFLAGGVTAKARFYNTASKCGGTYGMLIPGERPAAALTERDAGTFQLLSYSSVSKLGFRVNIGFASHTDHAVDLEIDLLGDDGAVLKTVPWTLQPFEHRQLTRIHSTPAPATASVGHGFATVRVLTPASLVHAYAMVIDNVSGDPIYLQPVITRR